MGHPAPRIAQGDLFDAAGWPAQAPLPLPPPAACHPRERDDTALIAALPHASQTACPALAEEVVRRRLTAAVPALEALCRRFAGFGREHLVREQAVALEALVALGGTEAAAAVGRLIVGRVIAGPGLERALGAAVALRVRLPVGVVWALLRDAVPSIRAHACRLARVWLQTAPLLIELLDDLHPETAEAAACALGEMGRGEARPWLLRQLARAPSAEIIAALAAIADEATLVLLGRLARSRDDLREPVRVALAASDHPRAPVILERLAPPRSRGDR